MPKAARWAMMSHLATPQPTMLPSLTAALRPAAPIRAAVVEDDAACRQSVVQAVQAAPDMRLAWQAAARAPALALLPGAPLDVLLVDLGLPDGSGLEVIAAARRHWPACAVTVSTIFGDEGHVLRSIEAGAMGYLLKDIDTPALLEEVRSLHAGGCDGGRAVGARGRGVAPGGARPHAGGGGAGAGRVAPHGAQLCAAHLRQAAGGHARRGGARGGAAGVAG